MKIQLRGPVSGGQKQKFPVASGMGSRYAKEIRQGPSVPLAPVPEAPRKREDDTMAMKSIDAVVKMSIYITVFLLPLFFFLKSPSVLELSKQVLLVIVVGIGFLAWVGKMAWMNEIRFKRSFILIPIITFLVVFGLSTAFSNYTEQSLWGYFGGEGKSFITTLFLVALFFLIVNGIKTKREAIKIIITFIASGFLVSLYGVLQIWGVYVFPADITKNAFFNTIGSVYIFSAYVGALFLMTLALFLSDISKVFKMVLIILSFFFFFVLMVINFKIVWIALIFCTAVLFGVTILKGNSSRNQSRVLPMIFLVLTLLMVLRQQPIIRKDLPIEVLLSHKSSAKIALNSFKHNPLLGSGPTTYTTDYQLARPDNLGDFWTINFIDGSSYFITVVSTMGILGTLSFLFLVGSGLALLLKTMLRLVSADRKDSENYITIGAGIVWLFATIMIFAYLANITFLLLWWFSFALFVMLSLIGSKEELNEFITTSETPKSSLALSFVFVLIIIGFIAAIYLQGQKYLASTHFNKALALDAQSEQVEDIAKEISKAIELDPNRDIYHRNLSVVLFALANKRVAEKGQDLTPEDSNYVSGMIREALASANRAVTIDPSNAENHIALANVYEGVLVTMDEADEKAIESLQEAIKLDPNNPILYQRIANIYVVLSDVELSNARSEQRVKEDEIPEESLKYLALARENLSDALKLRPEYAAANLLYAEIYERGGDIGKAIEKERENKDLFPRVPRIAFRLGLLYYKDNQPDNAKQEFEAAIALDKEYANARYFLGLVLDQQGDKENALVQFKKVSELNPDNEDLKKIITNLKNNKSALDGFEPSSSRLPVDETKVDQPVERQPEISPEFKNQEIPKEATPAPEEVENSPPAE